VARLGAAAVGGGALVYWFQRVERPPDDGGGGGSGGHGGAARPALARVPHFTGTDDLGRAVTPATLAGDFTLFAVADCRDAAACRGALAALRDATAAADAATGMSFTKALLVCCDGDAAPADLAARVAAGAGPKTEDRARAVAKAPALAAALAKAAQTSRGAVAPGTPALVVASPDLDILAAFPTAAAAAGGVAAAVARYRADHLAWHPAKAVKARHA
jgi:hypothetical protein